MRRGRGGWVCTRQLTQRAGPGRPPKDGHVGGEGSAGQMKSRQAVGAEGHGEETTNRHVWNWKELWELEKAHSGGP